MTKKHITTLSITAGLFVFMSLIAIHLSPPGPRFTQPYGVEIPAGTGSSLFVTPNVKRDYWPTIDWRYKNISPDTAKLSALETYVFTRNGKEADKKGIRTDALLIVKSGYLVYERYAGGYHKDKVHILWSDAKSFLNALVGIAVKRGKLSIKDFAYKYYPSLDSGCYRSITIDYLLRMSSGLYTSESYESSPFKSTVNTMLFSTGHRDMAAYAASQPLVAIPGEKWEYSSLTTNLISGILRKALGDSIYVNFPWDDLFNPIGVKNAVFEYDVSGTYVASSYIFTTPRDMLKLGYLYLNNGLWDGKQILPDDWVKYTTTVAPGYIKTVAKSKVSDVLNYGALWWLNRGIPEMNIKKPLPDVPADLFAASGHWDQFVFVIPSRDMVIAYTGDNRDTDVLNLNTLLKLIIDCFGNTKS